MRRQAHREMKTQGFSVRSDQITSGSKWFDYILKLKWT